MGPRDHRPPSNLGYQATGFHAAQGNATFGEPITVPSAPNSTRFQAPPRPAILGISFAYQHLFPSQFSFVS